MLQTCYFYGIEFRESGEGKGEESVFYDTLCLSACSPCHKVSPARVSGAGSPGGDSLHTTATVSCCQMHAPLHSSSPEGKTL